jgi:hypothetical protein
VRRLRHCTQSMKSEPAGTKEFLFPHFAFARAFALAASFPARRLKRFSVLALSSSRVSGRASSFSSSLLQRVFTYCNQRESEESHDRHANIKLSGPELAFPRRRSSPRAWAGSP